MSRKFRILKSKERYVTCYNVVNRDIYLIQEFKKADFSCGFGKKKWRNFWASSYGEGSQIYFYDLKEAQSYLKKLKEINK